MSHPIHLILSSGTRIVTRNEANRIGGGPTLTSIAGHARIDGAVRPLNVCLVHKLVLERPQFYSYRRQCVLIG